MSGDVLCGDSTLQTAADVGATKHKLITGFRVEYGTAGFRYKGDQLDHIMYRMGLLAALRSRVKQAAIGVMITASHNPEEDNGVKLVDPEGEMIESSWEQLATKLASATDEDLLRTLKEIIEREKIDLTLTSNVLLARDTRPSGVSLSKSVIDGLTALNSQYKDYDILTTPQLHYMVRCLNSNGSYGQPTVEGYYQKLSQAFLQLNSPEVSGTGVYSPVLLVDGANGVGALKMNEMKKFLNNSLDVVVYNDGSSGKLNHECGADYVKSQQCRPQGIPVSHNSRCASFDGDADRIVYYFTDSDDRFHLLDGDKIATLIAEYINDLIGQCGLTDIQLGVVQTAYANGASTDYLINVAKAPVACVPTGVKHLHHKAQQFDVGVYFEANGHGTILFKDSVSEKLKQVLSSSGSSETSKEAAIRLLTTIDLINQTVGDALSDMLLVETILRYKDWSAQHWDSTYTDLPNRLLKVKVSDRRVIETADAERVVTKPEGLQQRINDLVTKYKNGRSFVRPSGTEDVVRVYSEGATQEDADELAQCVSQAVKDLAGGIE